MSDWVRCSAPYLKNGCAELADHIVIVDDDELLRNRLRAYLANEGFRVTTAESATRFRDIMGRERIDLALVDLTMPGESGLSLTRFLRERSDIAVVILTGKGDPIDRAIGLEVGADDYVAKPFHPRELLARVRSVLRRTQLRSERAAAVGRWCALLAGASIWPSGRCFRRAAKQST